MTEILSQLAIAIPVIAALLGFFIWKKLQPAEKTFVWYLVINAFFEMVSYTTARIFENNLPGLHLYTLIQFIAITYFFKHSFASLNFKIPATHLLLTGSILIVANSAFFQSIYTYNSFSKTMVDLYIVGLAFFFFIKVLQGFKGQHEEIQATLSFTTSLFIQAAITSILYLYSNRIMTMPKHYIDDLWRLRMLSNIFAALIMLFGVIQIYIRSYDLEKSKKK